MTKFGEPCFLRVADFNITQDTVEALIKDSTILMNETLMFLWEAIRRYDTKERVAEIFEMRGRAQLTISVGVRSVRSMKANKIRLWLEWLPALTASP